MTSKKISGLITMNRWRRLWHDAMDYFGMLGVKHKLLVFGFSQSGKTSLIQQLCQNGRMDIKKTILTKTVVPTHYEFTVNRQRWTCYDFSDDFALWKKWCPGTDAIVFMIDGRDSSDGALTKINEVLSRLILGHNHKLFHIPVALLVNKMDPPPKPETLPPAATIAPITTTPIAEQPIPLSDPLSDPPTPKEANAEDEDNKSETKKEEDVKDAKDVDAPIEPAVAPVIGFKWNPLTETIVHCAYAEMTASGLDEIKPAGAGVPRPKEPTNVDPAATEPAATADPVTDSKDAKPKTRSIKERHIRLFPCSVHAKTGYKEAFQWMTSIISKQ